MACLGGAVWLLPCRLLFKSVLVAGAGRPQKRKRVLEASFSPFEFGSSPPFVKGLERNLLDHVCVVCVGALGLDQAIISYVLESFSSWPIGWLTLGMRIFVYNCDITCFPWVLKVLVHKVVRRLVVLQMLLQQVRHFFRRSVVDRVGVSFAAFDRADGLALAPFVFFAWTVFVATLLLAVVTGVVVVVDLVRSWFLLVRTYFDLLGVFVGEFGERHKGFFFVVLGADTCSWDCQVEVLHLKRWDQSTFFELSLFLFWSDCIIFLWIVEERVVQAISDSRGCQRSYHFCDGNICF